MREPIAVNPYKIDWKKGEDSYIGTLSVFVKPKKEYTLSEAFALLELLLRENEEDNSE